MSSERPPLGLGRSIAVAIGALMMVFSGGCAFAFIGPGVGSANFRLSYVGLILEISMIGFLPGLAIVLGALYVGRPK